MSRWVGQENHPDFHDDSVAGQDTDIVHPHLAGDVSEHLVPVLEFDPEHGVRERLDDRPLHQNRVVLGLGQDRSPPTALGRAKARRNRRKAERPAYMGGRTRPNHEK